MSDKPDSIFNRVLVLRGEAWACLILRLFVGFRLLGAGAAKFKGYNDVEKWHYDQEFYAKKMGAITSNLDTHTFLPPEILKIYGLSLGWTLMAIGVLLIIGLFTRLTLVAAGMLLLSLAIGLMLLPDDVEVVFRGVEIALTCGALALVRYNIFAVDNIGHAIFGSSRRADKVEPEKA